MAEVKNAFIKSKMNKDLDSRLLPSGEYRDGRNIQVSKSEGEDVGALENAVGNIPATTSSNQPVDFNVLSGCGCSDLESIGVFADTNSNNIYVFLTNYGPDNPVENAKYSTSSKNYIYSYNTLTGTVIKLVEGSFLNFSKKNPIYGINVLENLLFWTDNRNQPRKINLDRANPTGLQTPVYYNTEDKISVAKYNPYETINLYYFDTSQYTKYNTPGLPDGETPNPNLNKYVSSIQDVTSEFLPDGVTKNMYYNPNWPGDPNYLEDKFVTFSYRFIFDDGEQSIMAPFTQEAFIPKQDGYFLGDNEEDTYRSTIVRFMENKAKSVGIYVPLPFAANTLQDSLGVSKIEILYKESNSLTVKVLDSVTFDDFSTLTNGDPNTEPQYFYDYQSRKPYKTLPESEIIRVYDKVPVRALGQEVIGNRIVYSNFQDKHSPPLTIDYDVAVTPKDELQYPLPENKAFWTTSAVEYPMHTVKQNRNYQVGFVLSDRYGRQSTTILSPVKTSLKTDPSTGVVFGGSTYYHPYTAEPIAPAVNGINSWPGDSLKILINEIIPESLPIEGYPGLYQPYLLADGTLNSEYNPLGWYSYKVVVKQTEQDYYNVYLPGILDGYPDFGSQQTPPDAEDTIAHITLIGDNINKVPRDLTEVGPEQKQYRSDVKLFGRVSPERSTAPAFTIPYYPQTNYQEPVAIAEQDYIFTDAATDAPYGTIYQSDSDPYIARLTQGDVSTTVGSSLPLPIGSLQTTGNPGATYPIRLGVFETAPVESLLDIFWETSTSGLISDLNKTAGALTTVSGWVQGNNQPFVFNQSEATQQSVNITSEPFAPAVDNGFGEVAMRNSKVTLISVNDNVPGSAPITADYFALETIEEANSQYPWRSYNIKVKNPKRFEDNPLINAFKFTFLVENLGDSTAIPAVEPSAPTTSVINVTLINEQPTIDSGQTSIVAASDRNPLDKLTTFTGKNGATAVPNQQTLQLVWELSGQNPAPNPPLVPPLLLSSSGNLTEPTGTAMGGYSFNLVLKDTSGLTGYKQVNQNVNVSFGQTQINSSFGSTSSAQKISQGLESSGLFWSSNYNNNSLINSDVVGVISTGVGGQSRNAYNDLILQDDGLSNQSQDFEYFDSTTNPLSQTGTAYRWKNVNNKASRISNADEADSSLTEGTAYVKLNFRFKGWPKYSSSGAAGSFDDPVPPPGNQIGVSWLGYFQYRAQENDSWVTATDVEGQEIRFGSAQLNQYGLKPSPGGTFINTGLLSNNSSGGTASSVPSSRVSGGESREDVVLAAAPYVGSNGVTDREAAGSTVSKVFVFGKDQGYETNSDKFGEYRILIRYPQPLIQSDPQRDRIIPTPSTQQMPVWTLDAGPILTDINIDVSIEFGDFYYKKSDAPSSFEYQISSTGASNASGAKIKNTQTTVWAREWSHKYVTQFYTDSNLTTPHSSTTNDLWYSYSSLGSGSINSNSGTQNASTNGPDSSAPDASTLNSYDLNNNGFSSRRWVAQFDGNGKKKSGTATPCVSTF